MSPGRSIEAYYNPKCRLGDSEPATSCLIIYWYLVNLQPGLFACDINQQPMLTIAPTKSSPHPKRCFSGHSAAAIPFTPDCVAQGPSWTLQASRRDSFIAISVLMNDTKPGSRQSLPQSGKTVLLISTLMTTPLAHLPSRFMPSLVAINRCRLVRDLDHLSQSNI